MSEKVWRIGGMTLTGKKSKYSMKTCPSVTLSTTNPKSHTEKTNTETGSLL
jgi:hypothetical protein